MPGLVCKGKQVCNASSQVYDAGVLCVKTSVQARCAVCQARQCRMHVCCV